MMIKAMPLPAGTFFKNCSSASSPPAEAPIPTIGNAVFTRAPAAFRLINLAGVLAERAAEAFVFMRFLFPALEYDSFDSICLARRHDIWQSQAIIYFQPATGHSLVVCRSRPARSTWARSGPAVEYNPHRRS